MRAPVIRFGGIVALESILGFDYEQLVRTTCSGFDTCFKDVTLPFVSLLTGRNLARDIGFIVGDLQIEDLPIAFFFVSANLTRAQVHIHVRVWCCGACSLLQLPARLAF